MTIDWSTLLTADADWPFRLLRSHTIKSEDKIVLRTYTLKDIDQESCNKPLVSFVKSSVKSYILNEKEIELETTSGNDPLKHALQYFGKIDPLKDGKYGEMILYLLVESILKIPMVALKIPSSLRDQQKGSDGIFCGMYKGSQAILLGESKTWKDMEAALKDAFKSLDKLYTGNQLDQEYFVAKKGISKLNLTVEQLNYLYNCFSPTSTVYASLEKVHPVLIVYSKDKLKETIIEGDVDIEHKINQLIESTIDGNLNKIKKLCGKYQAVSKFHLDFFFIPVQCVDKLREDLYEEFHQEKWIKKPARKRSRSKKSKKVTNG